MSRSRDTTTKTYETTFKIESGVDKEIEVLSKETPPPEVIAWPRASA
jgi:hypothetical protein